MLPVDTLPRHACFYYAALFLATRNMLAPFWTSNPMWMKAAPSYRHRIAPSWTTVSSAFRSAVQYLQTRLSSNPRPKLATGSPFCTGTATDLPFSDSEFNAVLTSPPYATRLDYVMGTLPELAVLGADMPYISHLRRRTTGSPVVRNVTTDDGAFLHSQCGMETLESIASHASKGSRPYYFPWLRNYLMDLQRGLFEIHRTVDKLGTLCLVIQDSYYKERRIDLQLIVTQMLESRGRVQFCRYDHSVRTPRHNSNTESLLVFGPA